MKVVLAATATERAHETSVRVIEAAMGLAMAGKLTADDVIEMGCMTPECLTASTLIRVAWAAGIDPRDLVG